MTELAVATGWSPADAWALTRGEHDDAVAALHRRTGRAHTRRMTMTERDEKERVKETMKSWGVI